MFNERYFYILFRKVFLFINSVLHKYITAETFRCQLSSLFESCIEGKQTSARF